MPFGNFLDSAVGGAEKGMSLYQALQDAAYKKKQQEAAEAANAPVNIPGLGAVPASKAADYKMDIMKLNRSGGVPYASGGGSMVGVPSKDRLNETAVRNLSEARVIPTQLDELEGLVTNQSDVFGPIVGRLRSMNPYDEKSAIASSKIKAVAQNIGKYMEGGVLRAEDIPKYAAMLPGVGDTPEVAKGKIANVRQMMENKYNTDLQSYEMAGYNPGALSSIQSQQQTLPASLTGNQGAAPKRYKILAVE